MSHGFAINTRKLRSSATSIRRLGAQLGENRGRLDAQVAGSPATWGADEEGNAFAGPYQEVTAKFSELLSAITDAFDVVAENLTLMADNVDAADNATHARIAGIGERARRTR